MAKSIRADGVTDGPFNDVRHVVAGFYVHEAPDFDTALATAAANPVIRQGGAVEVRPSRSQARRRLPRKSLIRHQEGSFPSWRGSSTDERTIYSA